MIPKPKFENPYAVSQGISGFIWHVVRKKDYVVVGSFKSQIEAYEYRRILIKYADN